MRTTVTGFAFLVLSPLAQAAYTDQTPLAYASSSTDGPSDYYQFKWPIKKVAIIGAGVGGLIAYRELTQAGYDVHIYERDNQAGGNWHYTDEVNVDAPIPARDISVGDFIPSLPPKGAKLPYVEVYENKEENAYKKRVHRSPKPIWKSLTSNAPAPVQQIRELPWPAGTAWGMFDFILLSLPNQKLSRYLRAFASWHGLNANDNNPNISYNTRVELVEKRVNEDGQEQGWTVTVKNLADIDHSKLKATWTKVDYDAVVVATGRYNAPNIPPIQGLKEWNDRFPGHIEHSRQYRTPEPFTNQTVLIIGAATSGSEISRDIIRNVKKVYQSIRPQKSPVPTFPQDAWLKRIPRNTTIVPEIRRFLPPSASFNEGRVELINGSVRPSPFDGLWAKLILKLDCTKLFLGINDTVPLGGGVQPIVTDGTHLRSLYLDAFYIPDPTLTFINANYGMQSFTYAEFVSLAAAKIWARKADFPSTAELWHRYYKLYKERKGYGRHFQFLGARKTHENLRFFQGWLNDAAVKYGGRQIDGLSPDLPQVNALWSQARYATGELPTNASYIASLGLEDYVPKGESIVDGTEPWVQDWVFNDYW
ncbi:hypothetical protein CPB84DRAFT_1848115 [Gymnopilus junonius]|uniref:FAD/NAD(P)-binding domain-containing protein n=1 Tax=Gymnopilus junonius TaxID=109634 RepID=A0A9P5NLQ4_GYMJU|nr:hypothetical protein CPB84DRAFT_1848115 [Gymnopilus junonius]